MKIIEKESDRIDNCRLHSGRNHCVECNSNYFLQNNKCITFDKSSCTQYDPNIGCLVCQSNKTLKFNEKTAKFECQDLVNFYYY